MIALGKYSAWFKTPVGEGMGFVELGADGTLTGSDYTFAYLGGWTQTDQRFKAVLSAKRILPGPPGVFGLDELDIIVTGTFGDGACIRCTGFAKQTPGLRLDVTLTPQAINASVVSAAQPR